MRPTDLGLPEKFTRWRPGQDDAIIETALTLHGGKRFYVSAQPTGAGKSIYYVALSKLMGARRTLVLTISKGLQQQLESDFASMGMVQIKGQNNYACLAVRPDGEHFGVAPPSTRCDEGPCHAGFECSIRDTRCEYFGVAVGNANKAEIVVANYDYWMSICKHATDMPIGLFELLILDEAHDAPNKLAEFVSISLAKDELRELLGCPLPPLDAGLEYWAQWAKTKAVLAEAEWKELRASKNADVKLIRRLRDLNSKLADLGSATRWKRSDPSKPDVWVPGSATDWVAEEHPWGATFSPVWPHGYAESFLFSNIPKVVLTSATIVPQTLSYLGLSPDDFTFNERPSTFPVSRRPIYVVNSPNVRYGMTRGEELVWMNKIDRILDTRLDRKTIIHAVSYDRARFIYENSRHARHMVIHSSRTTAAEVERFRKMAPPAILVSPAVKTGWDFPYDQCDVQIIAKVPFVPMQSEVVKARHKSDKSYVDYLAIMDLIQSSGRGMRAADDHCETFIIDGNIKRLLFTRKNLFPRWFKAAIERVDTIPDPRFPPRKVRR